MLHILEAFQPDEYAVDAISPDILRTLREEELRWGGGRPTLTDLSVGYRPPLEEQLLVRVSDPEGAAGRALARSLARSLAAPWGQLAPPCV